MTRVQADVALGIVGLIWGFGFVAQKDGLEHIGPFTYVAVRFLISALVVLPLVVHERGFAKMHQALATGGHRMALLGLGVTFALAVIAQQYGLTATSVVHTSFITGLYVVLVPFAGFALFQTPMRLVTFVGCFLSIVGVWLLSGMDDGAAMTHFGHGDLFIFLCACFFAVQLVILGHLALATKAPFMLSLLQYFCVSLLAFALACAFEDIDLRAILLAWKPLVFSGLIAGGLGYTLQAIAQQHTPSADTAIILTTEALFGGVGGVWLLHEQMTLAGLFGCSFILASILLVEVSQFWNGRPLSFQSLRYRRKRLR